MATKPDLLQGTLDLLILKTLRLESNHGWGISQRIQQLSQEVLAEMIGRYSETEKINWFVCNSMISQD